MRVGASVCFKNRYRCSQKEWPTTTRVQNFKSLFSCHLAARSRSRVSDDSKFPGFRQIWIGKINIYECFFGGLNFKTISPLNETFFLTSWSPNFAKCLEILGSSETIFRSICYFFLNLALPCGFGISPVLENTSEDCKRIISMANAAPLMKYLLRGTVLHRYNELAYSNRFWYASLFLLQIHFRLTLFL